MQKKILIIFVSIIMLMGFVSCGNNQKSEGEKATSKDSETVAIHVGDMEIYLDEAKYYAYTSQASYETYYLTQGIELDWSIEMTSGSTWEQVVKSVTLDDISRRECMYSMAEQYNISLTEEEQENIDKMVISYYSDTNEKLQQKIGIEEKRLKVVFEKYQIAQKVESVMETIGTEEENKKPDDSDKEWKKQNIVTATKSWEDIRFDEKIFTQEDLTENQIMENNDPTEIQ